MSLDLRLDDPPKSLPTQTHSTILHPTSPATLQTSSPGPDVSPGQPGHLIQTPPSRHGAAVGLWQVPGGSSDTLVTIPEALAHRPQPSTGASGIVTPLGYRGGLSAEGGRRRDGFGEAVSHNSPKIHN